MSKKTIIERFQQLAGLKPLYENEKQLLNEDEIADCIAAGVQGYVDTNPPTDMTYEGQAAYFTAAMEYAIAGCSHMMNIDNDDPNLTKGSGSYQTISKSPPKISKKRK